MDPATIATIAGLGLQAAGGLFPSSEEQARRKGSKAGMEFLRSILDPNYQALDTSGLLNKRFRYGKSSIDSLAKQRGNKTGGLRIRDYGVLAGAEGAGIDKFLSDIELANQQMTSQNRMNAGISLAGLRR